MGGEGFGRFVFGAGRGFIEAQLLAHVSVYAAVPVVEIAHEQDRRLRWHFPFQPAPDFTHLTLLLERQEADVNAGDVEVFQNFAVQNTPLGEPPLADIVVVDVIEGVFAESQ